MSHIQEAEAMFSRYSEQKQEKVLMDLFRKLEDKSFLYGLALILYEKEERKRREAARNENIIRVNFGQ